MQQKVLRKFLGKSINGSIRLMSYNILADSLLDPAEYPEANQPYLSWNYRWPQLFNQIKSYTPDIICLQELDFNEKELSSALQNISFVKQYIQRGEDKKDGCAIFYKDQYKLLDRFDLPLCQPHLCEILDKPNVCLILVLEINGKPVIIANTHLLFNTKRGEIKLLQIQLIMLALQKIQNKYKGAPIALCGDFNIIPRSPLYQYLQGSYNFSWDSSYYYSGQLLANIDRYDNNYEQKLQFNVGKYQTKRSYDQDYRYYQILNAITAQMDDKITYKLVGDANSSMELKNPIQLQSANVVIRKQFIKQPHWSTYEPLVTSVSRSVKGCVDYCWIKGFKVSQALDYDDTSLSVLPDRDQSSDHFLLLCDLY